MSSILIILALCISISQGLFIDQMRTVHKSMLKSITESLQVEVINKVRQGKSSLFHVVSLDKSEINEIAKFFESEGIDTIVCDKELPYNLTLSWDLTKNNLHKEIKLYYREPLLYHMEQIKIGLIRNAKMGLKFYDHEIAFCFLRAYGGLYDNTLIVNLISKLREEGFDAYADGNFFSDKILKIRWD